MKTKNVRTTWAALLTAALLLVPATSWGQTTQRGVVAKANVTKVNTTDITTDGQVESAGEETTVTVKVTPQAGKVAKVTVRPTTVAATGTTISGATEVSVNKTITLTATVTPTYANTVVWTVDNGTGSAVFVTGEETTATTVTSVVDATTGTATATLKGQTVGEVTVNVKATNDAATALNETPKSVTVVNPATITAAPTPKTRVLKGSSLMTLCNAGAANNGTMMYAVSTSNTSAPTSGYSSSVPRGNNITSVGNYYIWYYAQGNEGYADSEKYVTANSVIVNNESSETKEVTGATTQGTNFTATGTYWEDGKGYDLVNQNLKIEGRNGVYISKVVLYLSFHQNNATLILPSGATYTYTYQDSSTFYYTIQNNNTGTLGSSFDIKSSGTLGDVATRITVYYY